MQIDVFEYYTVARANAALPEISKKYKYVLECRNDIMQAEKEIKMVIAANANLDKYSAKKQHLNAVLVKFYVAIKDLEKTGVIIKGINEGLLDFPSRRFDEDVCLCWKYGETEIKFWHEKNSGFSNRKPLAVSDESLT